MGKLTDYTLPLNQGNDGAGEFDGDLAVKEQAPKLRPPARYQVVMLNDDFTPMDFVVETLEIFFSMPREKAVSVMQTVHYRGKAVCGVYTRDIAETKAAQVNQYARDHHHPLLCEVEAVDDGEER
ncbi:ATP-dependent Clp protease adapter ClpS [Marinimicrobium alkaliphilum]|uniref:ATP-dependent Clp protease adapter ClpS n=1 Tax=Marinimicrobium alkaliphilum TaxID=2202654 RepID=UPI000DBABC21|nr:ATP-dependent Clp protease adapter ClpS [Marinimicrobium alkaliphilum]